MFKKRIEKLYSFGCDVDSAMDRVLNDEEFYFECLSDLVEDPNFGDLIEALKNKNVKKAFECAHTLKGVLANLGITPMYDLSVEIVEPLRRGEGNNLIDKAEELCKLRDKLAEIINYQED